MATLSDDDEGKRVVSADGDEVGMVESVEGTTAYVDPDPGITDSIKSKLGWGDADEDTYALSDDDIEAITDDEIRLRRE